MGKAKEHGFASGRRLSGWDWGWARSGSRLAQKLDRKDRVDFNVIWSPSRLIVRPIKEADPSDFYRSPGSVIPIARLVCVRKTLVDRLACRNQGRPRLTWSDTSSKSTRPAKVGKRSALRKARSVASFDARHNSCRATKHRFIRRSRSSFRYTARAITLERSRKQMLNGPAREVFRSLDTTPLPFDSTCLFVLRAAARWGHTLRRVSRTAHVVVCERRENERL